MTVTGKIKNVVDFGAFVDLGIKEAALVYISDLSDSYVKEPMDIVKAGELLEFRIIGFDTERRRISLSRKSSSRQGAQAASLRNKVADKNRVWWRCVALARPSAGREASKPTL